MNPFRSFPASFGPGASVLDHDAVLMDPDERPRLLSEADCYDILQRLVHFATGGGYTDVGIMSIWTGNVRWARNQITTSGEVCDNYIDVDRNIDGAIGSCRINDTTDAALIAAVRRAERLVELVPERQNSSLITRLPLEPSSVPHAFSDATYQLGAEQRAEDALTLAAQAAAQGMFSAGYIEVMAVGMALIDSSSRVRYVPYTQARYSVTVRDPQGSASGWAGVDWYDWHKIDTAALTAQALDKCLKSRNPVAIEPGRYTTILEPQAVADLVGGLFQGEWSVNQAPIWRDRGAGQGRPPFLKSEGDPAANIPGYWRFGEKVVDERITISSDPMDPDLWYPPFDTAVSDSPDVFSNPVYHKTTWIDHGVLTNLAYDRDYAIRSLCRDLGMPNSGAFRMSGGDTSVDEMIASTKRGLLVTRFDQIMELDSTSQLYRGFTRDGVWLIENGKISKAVKNFVFTESILFVLNNVEQLGIPIRAFHPRFDFPQPVVVPPLKVKEFSFTALGDAV